MTRDCAVDHSAGWLLRTGTGGVLAAISALALATACGAADSSASLTATQLIDRAKPGQTIVLPSSASGVLTIRGKTFARPITIDVSRARLSGVVIANSSGVRIVNGRITGTSAVNSRGISVSMSRNIEVSKLIISRNQAGIVLDRVQDALVANNTLTDLIADGIIVAGSQRVKIYYNSCSNFNPTPRVYNDAGQLVRDGHHADCIQAWSLKTAPPVSDVEIVGNRGYGNFQGIFLGNNVINGVSDGGYDRITITDNDMQIALYNGIYIADVRDARITRNRISTVPGSRDLRGLVYDKPIRAFMNVIRPTRAVVCGNVVIDFPTGVGTARC